MSFLKKLFNTSEVVVLNSNVDPDVIVKQIHNEVDSLEEQSIRAVKEMLAEIKIPTETKVVEKAKLMESLGFAKNNETVKESVELREQIQNKTQLKKETEVKLQHIDYLRKNYPNDKIIPMSEFQKVLKKYNLIYAPSKAYIKDVPEKNLLEIKNSIKTRYSDEPLTFQCLSKIESYDNNLVKDLANLNLESIVLNKEKKREHYLEICDKTLYERYLEESRAMPGILNYSSQWITDNDFYHRRLNSSSFRSNYIETGRTEWRTSYDFVSHHDARKRVYQILSEKLKKYSVYDFERKISDIEFSYVKRDCLFIAAPKTHFDLEGLSTHDGKEYYTSQKVQITHIKDPIAFYILRGSDENINEEYVRIVSKWGTSDDKSYLDPIVQNENLN